MEALNAASTFSFVCLLPQLPIFLIRYRLQPLIRAILAGDFEGEVGKPAIGSCSVPVFDVGRDMDDIARQHLHGGFPFFLIPTFAGDADEHLSAAFRRVVDVPVVPAAGFEGYVVERNLLRRDGSKVAIPNEILRVGGVGLADGENHFALEGCFAIVALRIISPDFLRHAEGSPSVRPAGVEGDVGEHL